MDQCQTRRGSIKPDRRQVTEHIRQVFRDTERPGDAFLQGSHEGCEPGESVAPFMGIADWSQIGVRESTAVWGDDLAGSCALPALRLHQRRRRGHRGHKRDADLMGSTEKTSMQPSTASGETGPWRDLRIMQFDSISREKPTISRVERVDRKGAIQWPKVD